mmetsp:Transcript_16211/g.24722  ORF Transcript_16211/g.24722 Transcript_16211/m.24722 type:complete len:205 (+) Transcript_16211:245-859(+)
MRVSDHLSEGGAGAGRGGRLLLTGDTYACSCGRGREVRTAAVAVPAVTVGGTPSALGRRIIHVVRVQDGETFMHDRGGRVSHGSGANVVVVVVRPSAAASPSARRDVAHQGRGGGGHRDHAQQPPRPAAQHGTAQRRRRRCRAEAHQQQGGGGAAATASHGRDISLTVHYGAGGGVGRPFSVPALSSCCDLKEKNNSAIAHPTI